MKKVLKIVIPILLVGLFIAIAICYAVDPEKTKNFAESLKEFALQPIPIIGFSGLTVGGLIFLLIRFIISKSRYGQEQIQQTRSELKKAKEEFLEERNKWIEIAKLYRSEALQYRKDLINICEIIPNKKVNDLGKNIENGFSKLDQELSKIDERIVDYVEKGKETFNYKAEAN